MKAQIWLQPHQLDLTVSCLQLAKERLGDGLAGDAHKMAARYTIRRIDEVLKILEAGRAKLPNSRADEPT